MRRDTQPDFVPFLHILRGVAVLMVVWAHFTGWWLDVSHVHWKAYSFVSRHIATPLQIFKDGGFLAVVIFFLISGYIISQAADREDRFEFRSAFSGYYRRCFLR